MTSHLRKRIDSFQEAGRQIGIKINYTESVQHSMVILQDEKKAKVIAVFDVCEAADPEESGVRCFRINTNQWTWADQEGFTAQQMFEKLGHKVFEPISEDAVLAYLS